MSILPLVSFLPFLILFIYVVVAGFGLWLAWQFVSAFASIARSLEDIAATYRSNRTNPSSTGGHM